MYSEIAKIDERITPRLKCALPLVVDGISGRSVDFNEGGVSFLLNKSLSGKRFTAEFTVDGAPIQLEMEKMWEIVQKGEEYLYGAKYLGRDPESVRAIRRKVVLDKINDVLKIARNNVEKAQVIIFSKALMRYVEELYYLSEKIESGEQDLRGAHRLLADYTDKMMVSAGNFAEEVTNKLLLKRVKSEFRTITSAWAYKGYIVKRSFDKPRGYPGDYRIMEYIYDETLISRGIGQCYDVYFQNNQYAESVRKRKDWMRIYLKDYLSKHASKNDVKILNVACGSNREIREMLNDKTYVKENNLAGRNITLNLLDQDEEALAFSKSELRGYGDLLKINYYDNDIMALMRGDLVGNIGGMDLIYTIGLTDYLPDRVLSKLLKVCVDEYLVDEGVLVIAHKDIARYKPLPPNWFCDWNFYSRDQKYIEDLLNKSFADSPVSIDYFRDDTGVILFACINKKKK